MPAEQESEVDNVTHQASVVDLDKLAKIIVALLRRELELDAERSGKLSQGR
jgi:hypothetical protein